MKKLPCNDGPYNKDKVLSKPLEMLKWQKEFLLRVHKKVGTLLLLSLSLSLSLYIEEEKNAKVVKEWTSHTCYVCIAAFVHIPGHFCRISWSQIKSHLIPSSSAFSTTTISYSHHFSYCSILFYLFFQPTTIQ